MAEFDGAALAEVVRFASPRCRLSIRTARPIDGLTVGGLTLNIPVNRFIGDADQLLARLGPDEWLLVGPESDLGRLSVNAASALAGRRHAVVDVSHRSVAFEVFGLLAAEIVNAGCPLDLDGPAFPTGAATRTILGKIEIVLLRLDDGPTFRIECWRSFATYAEAFLHEAARAARAIAAASPA